MNVLTDPHPARGGRVVLVGGGPGAEDLITVRGYRALMAADVVVADRLGPTGLLDDLPERAEVIDVGKAFFVNTATTNEIYTLLVLVSPSFWRR